jgi:hypothetical protein
MVDIARRAVRGGDNCWRGESMLALTFLAWWHDLGTWGGGCAESSDLERLKSSCLYVRRCSKEGLQMVYRDLL